jgi:hypothetical protein
MKELYLAGVREVVYTVDDGSYRIERVREDSNTKNFLSGVDSLEEAPVE